MSTHKSGSSQKQERKCIECKSKKKKLWPKGSDIYEIFPYLYDILPYPHLPSQSEGTIDKPYKNWTIRFYLSPMKNAKPGSFKVPYESSLPKFKNSILKVINSRKVPYSIT